MSTGEIVIKKEDGRWYKPCPKCGKEQSYLRKTYAISSFEQKKLCKSCSNKLPENNSHKGWVRGILRKSFVRKYMINASLRNIEWNVSYDYLADLLLEQDMKCKLTGWNLDALNVNKNTASLDRINSKFGYVEGNVQWVHKMVNMCKQNYSQEDFIKMCNAITQKGS
jgi:hypothetical protein